MNRRTALVATAIVLAIVAAGGLALMLTRTSRPAVRPATAVSVTVDPSRAVATVPADFAGLSFEAAQLGQPANAHWDPARGNHAALVRTLGTGVLRFGGNSLDRETAWLPSGGALPAWASVAVDRTDLTNLAAFSTATGWKVLFGIDLAHYSAASAGDEAAYAATTLGPRLEAFECGNEPNAFAGNGLRPKPYQYPRYRDEWQACAATVARSGPVAGPDTIGTAWTPGFVDDEHSRLRLATQHFYAISGCGANKGTATVTALLSPATDAKEAHMLRQVTDAARPLGLPVRLGETNSVSCGGQAGVSDTYAAALWGLDYMLLMAEGGAAGVNFHTGVGSCNGYVVMCATSAPNLAANILTPRPLYYGMLMFHLVGVGQMLPTTVAAGSANVTAYAVRGPDAKTRVVVIDKDPTTSAPITVTLKAGDATGDASVLHLSGSSLASPTGITIQAATVDPSGHFTPGTPDRITASNGTCGLTVASGSATLVTLP
jgi:hypothetical protein